MGNRSQNIITRYHHKEILLQFNTAFVDKGVDINTPMSKRHMLILLALVIYTYICVSAKLAIITITPHPRHATMGEFELLTYFCHHSNTRSRFSNADPKCIEEIKAMSLQWRHNKHDYVSNHRRVDCFFNRLFMRRSQKTPKLFVNGLCVGYSPVTGEFPAQSNAENVSIWWRHFVYGKWKCITLGSNKRAGKQYFFKWTEIKLLPSSL